MDRFFSKLDLRDIKIDPFNTSFPPDAEDAEPTEEAEAAPALAQRQEGDETARVEAEAPAATDRHQPERQPHVPAWAPAAPAPLGNGHATWNGAEDAAVAENGAAVPTAAVAPTAEAASNGEVAGAAAGSEVLKVSARSRPSAVAGAIAGVVRECGRAEVQAIGAGATNQAVKAVAIARDYLRETGIEAICLPAFIDVTIENEDRTAIRLVVEPR